MRLGRAGSYGGRAPGSWVGRGGDGFLEAELKSGSRRLAAAQVAASGFTDRPALDSVLPSDYVL